MTSRAFTDADISQQFYDDEDGNRWEWDGEDWLLYDESVSFDSDADNFRAPLGVSMGKTG